RVGPPGGGEQPGAQGRVPRARGRRPAGQPGSHPLSEFKSKAGLCRILQPSGHFML
ncbi:unnamed protein product, partial [Heterosigma akashiwo]